MSETPLHETEGPSARTLKMLGLGVAVIAVAVVGFGTMSRLRATGDLKTVAADASIPTVAVIHPAKVTGDGSLVLPGNVQAWNSAAIFARTNGYVRSWNADIGDKVGAGQTLAVLDAPDLDQQLASAKADYQTALANQKLAASTAKRWKSLLAQDAVSQQETDEKAGDYAAKTALANAALAKVRELQATYGFTRLSAPFPGVVTSRSAQIGALVVAGNAASQPLFTVSDIHQMRIYVKVPQVDSARLKDGDTATLTLPEYPGREFPAIVKRSAGSVDQQSGAVLVQLQAANPDGALKPGAYAQVHFNVQGDTSALTLPGSAVLYTASGPNVVVLGSNDQVTLHPITIAQDMGKSVLVSVGVKPGDAIVDSPPDSIANGDKVRVQTAADAGKSAETATKSAPAGSK
ncbi:efflux RND transporter periplasmic adaptor subunit [Novosphingobium sp. 9]|uniref:efflux RND transporter periplasmic adaptor subunit n=1 Tax=Novosphingobium sp. 9 TaxID=2025349 RepID=UPI0021B281F6|nr:efflux RND transporter periplasmic adaptor subunit [Novosphingobium sp. 9]